MPLRSKVIIYGVVMLILVTGLSIGSYLALSAASREAELAREELEKLTMVEWLKDHCISLGPVPSPEECREARSTLGDLTTRPWTEPQLEHLSRILKLSEGLEQGMAAEELAALHRAVSDFERSVIGQVERDLRRAERPAHRRAVRLLVAAALVAVGGAASFAGLYSRLMRERRALEARVARSEKLAALGTMAAGLAHEINNPLAAISMSAEVLADRQEPGSEDGAFLLAIQEEADRCRGITSDLTDLARGGTIDREPVDVGELLGESMRILARGGREKGIRTAVADGLPLISADRGKLLQVLVNLLTNSVEASGEDVDVLLTAKKADRRIRIQVRDRGRGIPEGRMDRIFEPFYTDKRRGVGLGLTLCHRIAELHGGTLSAASPGQERGATFTLELPIDGVAIDGAADGA